MSASQLLDSHNPTLAMLEDRNGSLCVSHRTATEAQLGKDQHQPPHTESSNLVHTPSHHKGVREVSLVHSDSQDGEDSLEEIYISIQFLRKRGSWP